MLESDEFVKLSKEYDICVGQFERLQETKRLFHTLKHLVQRCDVESANPVLAVQVEDVEHDARLVHEHYVLDADRVDNPVDLLAELFDVNALLASDSSL